MRRFFIVGFLVIASAQLHAEFVWPVENTNNIAISHMYTKKNIQLAIVSAEEKVRAISDAYVSMVREANEDETILGVVEIITDNGIRIAYIGVYPKVVIGRKVNSKEIIATVIPDKRFYIRMQDVKNNEWVDPLQVLPPQGFKNRIVKKISNFEFLYMNGKYYDNRRQIQRNMFTGNFRASLSFLVRDVRSKEYILPEYIEINIGKEKFIFTYSEILKFDREKKDIVNISNERVNILLPPISLKRGYYSIFIIVKDPFEQWRRFTFSILAR